MNVNFSIYEIDEMAKLRCEFKNKETDEIQKELENLTDKQKDCLLWCYIHNDHNYDND